MKSKNRSIQLSRIFIENGSNFFPFWRLLKKRSVNDFILASYILSHPNTTQKYRETQCCMIFHSDFHWKHSAVWQKRERDRMRFHLLVKIWITCKYFRCKQTVRICFFLVLMTPSRCKPETLTLPTRSTLAFTNTKTKDLWQQFSSLARNVSEHVSFYKSESKGGCSLQTGW